MNYKYFKGEPHNPFDPEKDWSASMFWDYEKLFDSNHADASAQQKEELFEAYLYNLLSSHLPDKFETEDDYFLKAY